MKKTNIIYVKLSDEQIQEVEKVNTFKNKVKPTHAIIWLDHGQIFGNEKMMSKFWENWTDELSEDEKDKSIDLRASFLECIKDDDYQFSTYIQEDFRTKIADITTQLSKELNSKRMGMVDDEYQEALARVRAGVDYETLNGGMTKVHKIVYILILVIVLASLSTLFNF